MTILIASGNIGSGKTLSMVYDMFKTKGLKRTYTNIQTRGIKNVVSIKKEMFLKKVIKSYKKNGEPIFDYEPNLDYWMKKEPRDIIIDEAHTLFSARNSMSKQNRMFSQIVSLARKIVSATGDYEGGRLVFISQSINMIDINARRLAQIRYHRCQYIKTCLKCNLSWQESSDLYEPAFMCPRCEFHKLKKTKHIIEVWKFSDEEAFHKWKEGNIKSYYDHYYIPPKEVKKIFNKYNTLQMEDLFSA